MIVSVFHMLSRQESYHGLGINFFDAQQRDQIAEQLAPADGPGHPGLVLGALLASS
jgi:hypothetical protein